MKRVFFSIIALVFSLAVSAQDIQTIVKKNIEATGGKALSGIKTMVVEGSLSQMGMSMDLKILEKRPGKIKMVTAFGGMEILQVINGDAGYMVNPMTGSTGPVSLTADQIAQVRDNSMLSNSLERRLNDGALELTGSSDIAGEAAFEIKTTTEQGDIFTYISKKSYQVIAVKMTASQMGQQMNVEMRMKDYTSNNGVFIPMAIDTYVNGSLSGTLTYNSIRFDVPVDDSEFEIK